MTKVISPLLFRFKNIPNYLNTVHIKLIEHKNYLTYSKFFKILLNFIYLVKFNLQNNKHFASNFLYIKCSYKNFYSFNISLIFCKLKKYKLQILYSNIISLFNYINYHIKFNVYKTTYFIFLHLKTPTRIYENSYNILKNIKNIIKYKTNFKLKIINFLNSLIKGTSSNITGIKCVYSGCLYKNSKKKSFKFTKGSISSSTLRYNIIFNKTYIKTINGVVGIKLWLHK